MKKLIFNLCVSFLLSGCVTTQQLTQGDAKLDEIIEKDGTYVLWAVPRKFPNNGTIFCPLAKNTTLFLDNTPSSALCAVTSTTNGFTLKAAVAGSLIARKANIISLGSKDGSEIFFLKKVQPGKYFPGGLAGTNNATSFSGDVPLYNVKAGTVTYIGHFSPNPKASRRRIEHFSFWASMRVKNSINTGVLQTLNRDVVIEFPSRLDLTCKGQIQKNPSSVTSDNDGCWVTPIPDAYTDRKENHILSRQEFKITRI